MPVSSRKFKNISIQSKRLLWKTSNITVKCRNLKNLWLHMWLNFANCHDIASSEPWKTCSVMDWYVESATTTSSTIFLLKLTSVSKNHLNWLRLWSQWTETQKATGQSATVYVVHKQGSSGSATDAGAGTGQATVDSKMQNVACRSKTQEAKRFQQDKESQHTAGKCTSDARGYSGGN